ncbi:Stemmadenine O-acetyltransferase [Linum grandiflorum]
MGSLNNLLPFKTFCSVPETDAPQTGFQVNMFECGGLALGLCSSHKSHDGIVVSAFLKVWAAISMNRPDKIVAPDFVGGPLTFPATKSMLHRYVSLAKAVWFENGGNPVTRRFLFVGESIAKLRAIARGEMIEQPTRAEAVSAFLWKFIILSSKSQKHSVLTQSVDLRRVIKKNHPPLTSQSFGNLVLFSDAKYSGPHDKPIRIDHLAGLIRAGVNELVNVDYLNKGSKAIFEYYDRQAEIEDENTHVINFACWHGFGFSKTDFGWGPPVWVGLGGATGDHNASSYCSNSIVLIESGGDGIEAWVTLEEDVMSELELDPDFLLFASRNFPILRLPMHAKL